MPDIKLIPTTNETIVSGSNIQIINRYEDPSNPFPDIISCYISDSVTSTPISQIEGDLIMNIKNNPERTDAYLNDKGELIVTSPDSNGYSINEFGELIYN